MTSYIIRIHKDILDDLEEERFLSDSVEDILDSDEEMNREEELELESCEKEVLESDDKEIEDVEELEEIEEVESEEEEDMSLEDVHVLHFKSISVKKLSKFLKE